MVIYKHKQRITKKDIYSLMDAINFISGNTDCVTDKKENKYYDDLLNRLNKIYEILKNKNSKK